MFDTLSPTLCWRQSIFLSLDRSMRIAPLGFCVALFALLAFAHQAQADPCYPADSPYYRPCPGYDPDLRPQPRPCPDCEDRWPGHCPGCPDARPRPDRDHCPRCPGVRRRCPECGRPQNPRQPAPPPETQRCTQQLYNPRWILYRIYARQDYLPAVDYNRREICHFRSGDAIWVPRECLSGQWCWIPLSDRGGFDAAVFLPR